MRKKGVKEKEHYVRPRKLSTQKEKKGEKEKEHSASPRKLGRETRIE